MKNVRTHEETRPKPLRLWPGMVAVAFLCLARWGLKVAIPGFEGFKLGMMSAILGAFLVFAWWVFLSRAPWMDRGGAILMMASGLAAAWFLKHPSMGPLWILGYAIPILCLAFVVAVFATRHLSLGARRAIVAAAILLACGGWTLARTEGISGDHVASFAWRWSPSAEERLLAKTGETPPATSAAPPAASTEPDWPGFRGPGRDGHVGGTRIATDWTATPPVELWRRPIGPGWSSFAMVGGLLYTQEQRGAEEVVSCYASSTGEPVWRHGDPVRFFESNAGAGPRATPTVRRGRVYALGATGILNVLDAASGTRIWTRDLAADTDTAIPDWGFSSSPLVLDDLVIAAASGQLIAYDLGTGEPRWRGPKGGVSYASPQRASFGGEEQIVMVSGRGVASFAPASGEVLWEHAWPGFPMVQPAVSDDGWILINASEGQGLRRLAVARQANGWSVEERWTSLGLKPYFNGFVVHEEHAYGFDGRILSCIDLESGERLWKGGRYGNGQLVLLPEQDLLLVLSERGELALVAAAPDSFTELARLPALEGKTWNHPVLAGDLLVVRNSREMAAFRLAPGDGES